MKRVKGKLPWIVLLFGLVIILVPLFNHNHIYQTITESTDIQAHSDMVRIIAADQQLGVDVYPLLYIKELLGQIESGNASVQGSLGIITSKEKPQPGLILYPIQYLFGWVLGTLDKTLPVSPENIMLAFMFLVLVGVVVTLYAFGKVINGSQWFTLAIPLFCTTAILGLFAYGVVYSVINMAIVLLWAIISVAKWTESHKVKWFVAGVALFLLFLILHPTGLYLLFALPIFAVGIAVKRKMWWLAIAGVAALSVGVIFVWDIGWLKLDYDFRMAFPYFRQFIFDFLSPITAVLGALTAWALWHYKKEIHFSNKKMAPRTPRLQV